MDAETKGRESFGQGEALNHIYLRYNGITLLHACIGPENGDGRPEGEKQLAGQGEEVKGSGLGAGCLLFIFPQKVLEFGMEVNTNCGGEEAKGNKRRVS